MVYCIVQNAQFWLAAQQWILLDDFDIGTRQVSEMEGSHRQASPQFLANLWWNVTVSLWNAIFFLLFLSANESKIVWFMFSFH